MGWSGGTDIFSVIIREAVTAIPDKEVRKNFYKPIYNVFKDYDWDTEHECLGLDRAFNELILDEEDEL